ncbi:DEAD/DEAH box helicase [Actinacidiphila bryophytorum]|uniref:ATP-dependent helicase n=1 Tax=Actinacidiphila bryophytorum TaxID=1436133 RepID=A0A9W4EDR7_9ACTN|nr:DEAD/DEAH box helicase [Actinacidiphila bryophytorum]MBM9434619.1 DEAD/DEAH box helicase [Actinacidiphila bryophytorum]MBN6543971.1 DEAD/DEAH box helicase [Actinacidiphila bryophytorum]CAG7628148.1 ATP-dependent helicase [Actinacidiphila bryophytorum]
MSGAEDLDAVVLHHVVNTLGWPGLRPLQEAAVQPLLAGDDALLLAPTAGGKTEAAVFPLLTRMTEHGWTGTAVLYVCPLKALLNNLLPRLETYTAWVGRSAALWHGDVGATGRKKILTGRPDVLLTTPESLEAMLVSANVDHRAFFAGLRTIVVDEVHAFAGDDRGWHLLAVLERLQRLVGRPLQRVGLSATVGNPEALLEWLQGSGVGSRPGRVVAPHLFDGQAPTAAHGPPPGDIQLDYVGSVGNAATVIAALHRGEKRLVFCESRRLVEELGEKLRTKGVTTFLSHASLSVDERRRAEEAFADARDCVIVSTSTLELGIDVGDLDRVIQIDAPATVASFLQRLGRTGRRADTVRNCLFLALDEAGLLAAAAMLHQWSQGWVEPVVPPPEPRHIVAQQILALCLQEHQVGDRLWKEWWAGFGHFGQSAEPIVRHLLDEGYLDRDGDMLFIGPEAERRFGHRHFMNLTAVFTAAPEFTVLNGLAEIGKTDPTLLTEEVSGPRRLLLAGRSWQVTYVDWKRRRCFVEPVDGGGRAKWGGVGLSFTSYALTRAAREVVLGADPQVRFTGRATSCLAEARERFAQYVHPDRTLIVRHSDGDVRWWTWAGHRANATLTATLASLADPAQRPNACWVRLSPDLTPQMWKQATADAGQRLCLPAVHEQALKGLKFSTALPQRLAEATLAARLADLDGAAALLGGQVRFVGQSTAE